MIIKLITNFEKKLQNNLKHIFCPIHLSLGHEKVAKDIYDTLKTKDWLYSYHRNHHHYLAKRGSEKKLWDEILGKKSGLNKGYAGSQSITDARINFHASAIVGGLIGVAAGTAFAIKKTNNIVVCCIGDAGTEQGVFWESLNFIKLYNLPIVYICENNKKSVDAHIKERQAVSITPRVKSFKIKTFKSAKKAILFCKKYRKPAFAEIKLKLRCAHINMATMTELV